MASRSDAYKAAYVDIDAANDFIGRIKGMVGSTFTKGVVTDIGGFGGLFKLDLTQMEEPVLVAGADGVGTKLKLAFAVNKHDTIGIDLVAMSVNDILVQEQNPCSSSITLQPASLSPVWLKKLLQVLWKAVSSPAVRCSVVRPLKCPASMLTVSMTFPVSV